MSNPLISVAIVAYNRRQFLLSALKSVVNQTFKDYEVVVAKNFHDQAIDGFITKYGFKEVFIDSRYYGEQLAAAIEESKGNIISFLEDDDKFEPDKLHWVKEIFTKYKVISYVHDTRKYIDEEDKLISPKDPKYRSIILFYEKITPHRDIVINPRSIDHVRYLLKYYGVISTVSLMSIRAECIRDKLKQLKRIYNGCEHFIPAVAGECGLLYHTARRLTRYRLHSSNVSIAFSDADRLRRMLFYYRKCIDDYKLIVNEVISRNNNLKFVIKFRELPFKYTLSTNKFGGIFKDVFIRPGEIYELCKLENICIDKCHNNHRLLFCFSRKLARLLYATTVRKK